MLEFKGIAKRTGVDNPLYIDIYISAYPADENDLDIADNQSETYLIVLLEDVTEKMLLRQALVQHANETSLFLSSLSRSQSYINKVVSFIADILFVTTDSGIIKTINHATQDLFEYSEAELVGQPITIIFDDPSGHQFNNHQNSSGKVYPSNSQHQVEVLCRTKTGKKILVSFSRSTIQPEVTEPSAQVSVDADEGNIIYIGRDITAYQHAQQRLAAHYATNLILSESASYQQAISQILQMLCEILEWDIGELWMVESTQTLQCLETWIRTAVPELKTEALMEFTAIAENSEFVMGTGMPGQIWTDREPLWIEDVTKAPKYFNPQGIAAKAGLHTAFGFPITVDSSTSEIHNSVLGVMIFFSCDRLSPDRESMQAMSVMGGQIGQFIKRRQAEAALLASEQRYRDLFENASDLIQCVATDGQFIYVNRAWHETLGYRAADLRVVNFFDVIHPDCLDEFQSVWQRLLDGEEFEEFETGFVTTDGKKILVEGHINCQRLEGKTVAIRAILRDITHRIEAAILLRQQQEQTERLIKNILPEAIAQRLKEANSSHADAANFKTGHTEIAESFAAVTVMFADLVGFTELASSLSAIELVSLLNQIFSRFDQLCETHGLEKIKTVGDAYMVVGGLPQLKADHAEAIATMALEMQIELDKFNATYSRALKMRIGIHTGPVVAGVIGLKKFIYDLWGDTVNIASRMESHGMAGYIQVTEATYKLLQHKYIFKKRGMIKVKGKGNMITYILMGKKEL